MKTNSRPALENNHLYHIIMRGIDGINIFKDQEDYLRCIHDIFEFNDIKLAPSVYRMKDAKIDLNKKETSSRDLIVNVSAFCLMPTHIHLILEQLKDGGISLFVKKLSIGYVRYYNNKYQRKGHLFQGRFKAVLIKTDEQMIASFIYVHTNPASIIDSNWKLGGINDPNKIIKFIENYKWSSYKDYLGIHNFPSLTNRDFFLNIMSNKDWQQLVNNWVYAKEKLDWHGMDLEG